MNTPKAIPHNSTSVLPALSNPPKAQDNAVINAGIIKNIDCLLGITLRGSAMARSNSSATSISGKNAFGKKMNPARITRRPVSIRLSHFLHMKNGFIEEKIQKLFTEYLMIKSLCVFTNHSWIQFHSFKS